MDSRYKIILSNNNLYKEIELSPDMQIAKVGTSVECDFRLHKDFFFGQIELIFTKSNNGWSVICSDNLYVTVGDVRKFATKQLEHGDILEVRYQDSDNHVFSLEFLLDFDNGKRKYERVIDVLGCNNLSIGTATNCNIVLKGNYVKSDYIELLKQNDGFSVRIQNSTYGMYHNGKKAVNTTIIANGDFFSVSDYFFYYKDGKLWTEIRADIAINYLNFIDKPDLNNYPRFNRNTRIKAMIEGGKIEVLDPPPPIQKPKGNIISSLLPSLIMVVAGLAMSMLSPFMLISSGIGVVTGIMGLVQGNKDYKKSSAERIIKYNAYIENKKREIEQCRNDERKTLEEIYLSPEAEQHNFATFSSQLFDRDKKDVDFLSVRLGTGLVEAKREINYKKHEKLDVEDELQQIPETLCNQYKYINNAPIVCDLTKINAVCIVGELSFRFEIFKNFIIDISARHYYSDVKMFFIAEEENKEKLHWLRFLPHAFNDELGIRNMVCDGESKNIIFEYLYKVLTQRKQNKEDDTKIVAFFFDECGFKSHPISKFVEDARELGITFVFFEKNMSDVPLGCDNIIEIKDTQNACLINTSDKNDACNFIYPSISTAYAESIVNLLAPIYTEEISLEGTLTKNISLFELLNIIAVDDIDLESRWKSSQVFKTMAAPLGVSKSGVVSLDLHDKAHGPHGLVAGTTGSGKSEILQTYILAMSTLFHPYEVSFVIIDFKGGGMVNQFKELPHLLGAITNIDGKEIDRSLKSIKAELQKRQRLFADADVNHIDKYIKKFKSGEVRTPLPHLIIIVDEFAELKAEQPEFMKELISAARIGRSLGVHLILATQKPSGQVDDQIWSNSKFKLCLKVQSQEDSNEVIKSPLAAEIKEPGRAYLQVGNNEIFELFQSAYSGAPEKVENESIKEFSIYSLSGSGKKIPVFVQKKEKASEQNLTQLEAIVKYVNSYCCKQNIAKLSNICLPPLPDLLPQPDTYDENKTLVDIGLFDDPDNQIQAPAYVDLQNRNTLIIGSSQFGKTNLLQSIIKNISTQTSPKESVFYILDFGSMVLKNFERLNHVGGVVTSSEDEKLKNLFKLLFEEITVRKEKLLSVGVSSFSSYVEAGYTDLPHIYVIVDNVTALMELYLSNDDSLLSIVREGISVGISTIMANNQTAGIGYRYLSNFANKIVLYCNDSAEYTNIFDHVTIKPDEKVGRCVLEIDKNMLECQTYLAFEGEKEIERVQHMRSFIETVNSKYEEFRAKQIPYIPNVLDIKTMLQVYSAAPNGYSLPVGLAYDDVKPYVLNLNSIGILGITGKEGFGHKNFVSLIVKSLMSKSMNDAEIVIFDDVTRKYAKYKDSIAYYSLDASSVSVVVEQWHKELKRRYDGMMLNNTSSTDDRLLVMIVQNNDVASAIQSDMGVLDKFNEILTRYKDMGVCIIFANYPNTSISYDAPDAIRTIRQRQHVICLDDLQNLKCIDPPYDAIRQYKKPISVGDGYYVNGNDVVKLKLILAE
ncbi:MAG: type VII secretion protein EssC [Lachnospiraceae bacterium]|nr:type VII secretion protein EssC [Lachnospiraceae bacterium]